MARNGSLDLLRIGLALMVVAIHVNPLAGFGPAVLAVTGDGLFRMAVPAFFVMNGYFLLPVLREGKAWPYIRRILVLYAIWMVLYLPLSWKDFVGLPPAGDLRMLLFGFWHLWYLPALAVAAALAWPMRDWPTGRLLAVAAAVFVAGALVPLGQAMGLWQIEDWTHRNGLFLGLPFVLAGLVIRREALAERVPLSVWLAAALVAALLVPLESLALRGAPQWSAHDNLFSLALAAPLAVLAALRMPPLSLPPQLGRISNGIYFCHVGALMAWLATGLQAPPLVWGLTVVTALALTGLILRLGLERRLL